MTEQPRRCVLYARYSSDMQNPKSVDDQFAVCTERAIKNGWNVVDVYSDKSTTGSTNKRPGYQTLLSDVSSGAFDIILLESLDRLSRDQEDVAHFFKRTRFHDVAIETLDHGRITAMHIGFAGTMNALFLEGLKEKTHRGLKGRVEEGKSGGGRAYGYRTTHTIDENGKTVRGGLEIDDAEAKVVRRIFEEYSNGRSPHHIAAALNAEGIPAPRHKTEGKKAGSGHWKQNTINGNRQRGTGILNNELYIGRRVWNRLEYRKDPISRTRVSRLRPESDWVIHDLPDLRIIHQDLWDSVKRRQDAQIPQRQKHWTGDRNRLSGSQTLRRRKYLLSGLLECGTCGGKLVIAGSGRHKRYYCANSREKGEAICKGMPGLRQDVAEKLVLSGFRKELMLPEAFETFRTKFIRTFSEETKEQSADHLMRAAELAQLETKRDNIVAAVANGHTHEALFRELTKVEQDIKLLSAKIEATRPRPIEIPQNLPELFHKHIDDLAWTLSQPDINERAADELRSFIERLVIRFEPKLGHHTVEIVGELAKMLAAADAKNAAAYDAAACSIKLVVGAGFEPAAFRL